MDYDEAKRLARDPDATIRRDVAERTDLRPEVLYYLAVDNAVEVRRAVAGNPVAPIQASQLLARDPDAGVRGILAAKLARALPELDAAERGKLFQLTVATLEQLAKDQVLDVRQALATALADIACAPPRLCLTLATDIAREVAEPILHYCATLTDQDLLALIAGQPRAWALAAIAARPRVSAPVAEALHASGDVEAGRALIENAGAEIPEPVLARMVEDAAARSPWQAPLARRPRLPARLAVRLAEFVDDQILALLRQNPDLDAETVAEVAAVARRRLDYAADPRAEDPPEQRARRLFAAGQLDEETLSDALSWQDLDFVKIALALRGRLGLAVVESILATRSPKAVTALAWRAGLSMRFAMQLQARGANIPPRQLLNARNGVDYPLSSTEMSWQLEFHGAG